MAPQDGYMEKLKIQIESLEKEKVDLILSKKKNQKEQSQLINTQAQELKQQRLISEEIIKNVDSLCKDLSIQLLNESSISSKSLRSEQKLK